MHTFTPVDFDPFADEQEIEKIIYTNEPQKEMWLACMIGGQEANLSYNESVSLELKGSLNFNAFEQAVQSLVQRHEALRSTISPNGETLIVYKQFPVKLLFTDISGISEIDQKTEIKAFLRREIDTPLNLTEGPLFRAFIHKVSERKWLFTIIKHHIIGDGWSTGVMLEDLAKFYNAYNKTLDASLAEPSQLSDYASWQAVFKQSAVYQETEDFWVKEYKNGAPVLNLPIDRPRQPIRTYKGHRIDAPLSHNLASEVKAIGARAGASLVTTLLTAFEILLYQKTQQTDVVVGLPAAGQAASGLSGVVGHCVNLLPLLSHIVPASSFINYLKKRKKEVLDAYDHQNITFGELIRKLYIPRDSSRIPLVPVIFNIDMGIDNAVSFDGLELKLISNPRSYENFELYLNVTRSKEGMVLEWSYNTDLFDAQTIEGYHNSYIDILQALADTPEASIAQIAGVQQKPVNLSISFGNKTHIEADTNLVTLFGATAKQYASKVALTFNQTTLTYAQLDQKINQLSAFLVQKGVSKGDIVALLLDRSAEMVVAMLAVLKAGAAYLPLDPNYPEERIAFMLQDSAAKLLLISQAYKGIYATIVKEIVIEDIRTQLNSFDNYDTTVTLIGDDLAYVIYTSGSTGKPKGVKITHGNLINFLLSMQKEPGVNTTDRVLAITTISFDIAGLELYVPLISGAELIVADAETARDGRLLVNRIAESNISVLQATPSTWQMLNDSGMQRQENLKALSGGEPLSKELANQLLTLTASLWNMYGPTETTVWSTLKQVIKGENLITIGKPINNTQVYIMHEKGDPLPVGTSGEICIGGYGVAQGYLNRDGLTAEKFVADTTSQTSAAKLYRTGDLGKLLDNGEIQCLGRIDDQVKIRGHRIELGEIENSISLLDGVKQCVVMAYDDALLNKYLVAFVITDNTDAGLIPSNLTHIWREKLAAYLPEHMLPEEFIKVAAFPKTPSGKTDRKALIKPERKQQFKSKALPVTDKEKLIAKIFSDILGITNVGIADDFFALGGHSLLAVKVMVAIEKVTGERLPLAAFFNNSTVEKLAALLAGNKTNEDWETVVPIKKEGIKPPLFLVHGSGLNLLLFKSIGDHFDEDHPLYGIQAIGLVKPVELPESVEAIAAYHVSEILKARPEGPYAIAGYSYGGFIAYEIVKKLIKLGKTVSFFGIIDTDAWAAMPPKTTTGRIIKKVIRQFHKIPFFVNSFIQYPGEALSYQQLVFKRKFAKKDSPISSSSAQRYTAYEQQLRKSYNNAVKAYRIAPFDIEVSLFKVEKRIYFVDSPKFMGWNKIALKGVKVYTVPGDHNTFRLPPHDRVFAAIIQKAMDVSAND